MNKFSILLFFAFLVLRLNVLSVSAQQPEAIDVVSLKVGHYRNIDSQGTITYRDSSQTLKTFNGFTGFTVSYNTQFFGASLSSNTFNPNYNIYDSPGTPIDFHFRFTLTSIDSEPIILRPTILRKKRYFTLSGATVLHGKLEILKRQPLGPATIIGVDNNFELRGRYKSSFFQNNGNQRTAVFDSLVYELNAVS